MNCDAIVSKGNVAWMPRSDAYGLDVLHMHDFPLLGTFQLAGETVLFACLTGASSATTTVWGYVPITEGEAVAFEDPDYADSTADLEDKLHALFVGRRAVFALAKDYEIDEWSTDDVGADGVMEAVIRFMDLIIVEMTTRRPKPASTPSAAAVHRQAEQGRVDATREALEPVLV